MTITYNDKTYDVMPNSVYFDFSIMTYSLEEALEIVRAFDGMTDYVFNIGSHSNMVIVKRIISIGNDGIIVKVKLREKTEAELVQEELEALRKAMADLAETTNKTTTAKINKILDTEGVK